MDAADTAARRPDDADRITPAGWLGELECLQSQPMTVGTGVAGLDSRQTCALAWT
jgi:hypothetical protein